MLVSATVLAEAASAPRACTGAGCPKPAPASLDADEAFVAARQAVSRNDAARFEQVAARVGPGHPLRDYVDYWRLRLQLADARLPGPAPVDEQARAFVALHAGTLLAELARRDWLMSLGRRAAWDTFDAAHAGAIVPPDDSALRCHALQSRLERGEAVMAEARELLMAPRDLGDACNALLSAAAASGQATPADLRTRLERALESGAPAAVRRAAALLDPELGARPLDAALSRPQIVLQGTPSRDLALIALVTLARSDPAAAAARLETPPARLSTADRAFAWSQVAAAGMRRLHPDAHAWALEAHRARPSDETLAWLVRAALRAGDWAVVGSTIDRMSEAGQADQAWVYWRARALQADAAGRPEQAHQARVLLTSIADPTSSGFYAQLAAEDLGLPVMVPPRATPPTPDELAEARSRPGFARAAKFYELGLRLEGNREWSFQLRGLTDRQLLAAAEHARQLGLLDRSIQSADRTRNEHDYALRFPAPFADRLEPIARAQGLEPAWVYGLIRQESRFVTQARSSAGASGLMQIMPATATWIARKIGERDFVPSRINELDTNLRFGSFYLRTVAEGLERSPLLASAAYTAGPGRPRSWRGTLPRPVEGAVFAEIVPFTETRGYVKAVLANTTLYAALFTDRPQSLKALLGEVQPGAPTAATASPGGD
jgi:soluble lytic murein transglycosylase